MNRHKRLGIVLAGALLLLGARAEATSIHRKGCEDPMEGVRVCWEATGEAGSGVAPFPEVHLLALAQDRGGEKEVLAEFSRKVFAQMLPGNFAEHLFLEWDSALYLDQVLQQIRQRDWPAVLWIAPRTLRNSGAATPGVVDWEVQLIDGKSGKLIRTLRVRVESHPKIKKRSKENGMAMGGALLLAGKLISNPLESGVAVATAMELAQEAPPEAGQSLDLMMQLATRQVMFLFQYPVEELLPPPAKESIIKALNPFDNDPPAPGLPPAAGVAPGSRGWFGGK
ncbi:MAG: hypothetical protein HQL63_15820 [Magnetococcales bacterium]|nr:hypothetical protein [Magnetococcales bacterium]MBF0322827.1 hypothetical protein [Magnetococcales bacterium]